MLTCPGKFGPERLLDWTAIGRPSVSVPALGRVSCSDEWFAELILRVGPSKFFGRAILQRPVRPTLLPAYAPVAFFPN
jgi:hypothetical protein